ncbi:tRNA1(Val) (adenine(37)-N6)-methyltransferase [Aquimarina spongiae]|uniref:tRNA1(Val) (adenine(37)-N6)-methyltransferase n=1 Tax=Aquimarina spongiae TaxID=570521 RepID=A0A1M6KQQ6_9FLAO|nr:methyltransferase [Aquimarina spongiae]SHJ61262.1 tRNA1Val (adenine37-N6)-methyltransferase [Aquimarina spongiae]
MDKPFQFKQFTIQQDRCAMKIGTDGVLLGAWAPIDDTVNSILDVGTGTGVIALMMAQRSQAQIVDALEIDADAYEQAVENFEASSWGDRLFCYHASFQEFAQEIDEQYDLLISNPPFFAEDYKTDSDQRDLARFQDALPFDHLLIGASKLLSESGRLAIIVPFQEEGKVVDIAEQVGLFVQKNTRVKGAPGTKIKRSLLVFTRDRKEGEVEELVIEKSRHVYTDQYIDLVKDFYLKM